MKYSSIFFVTLGSLSLQAMKTPQSITIKLQNDKYCYLKPKQHKQLCCLSKTYADIAQDTEKELGSTQVITLNNIPKRSFSFIKKHLNELNALVNNVLNKQDIPAFKILKENYEKLSKDEQQQVRSIVKEFDLPTRLYSGLLPPEIVTAINCALFNDRSEWPLISHLQSWILGKKPKTLKGHTDTILAFISTSDFRKFFSSSLNGIMIWDLASATCIKTIEKQNKFGDSYFLLVTPDNSKIISGSYDGTIKIWDLKSCIYNSCKLDKCHNCWSCPVLTSDSQRLIFGSDKAIKIIDLNSGTCTKELIGHESSITCLKLDLDNKRLISKSHDKTIKIWNLDSVNCIQTINEVSIDNADPFLTTDNKSLICACDKTIKILDLETGACIKELNGDAFISNFSITPDNEKLVCLTNFNGKITVWDLDSGKCITTMQDWMNTMHLLIPHSKILITFNFAKVIQIWNLESGISIDRIHYDKYIITPDSSTLIVAYNNKISVWDLKIGQCIYSIKDNIPKDVDLLTPDNERLIINHQYSTCMKILDLSTGKVINTLEHKPDEYGCYSREKLTLTPDKKKLIACSYRNIKIWNLNTLKNGLEKQLEKISITDAARLYIIQEEILKEKEAGSLHESLCDKNGFNPMQKAKMLSASPALIQLLEQTEFFGKEMQSNNNI